MGLDVTLNSLYICVRDMNRAIDFYEDFLEQPVTKRNEVFSVFNIKGFKFSLFDNSRMDESVKWGDNCLPSFEVQDMPLMVEKLNGMGVEIVFPLTKIDRNWVLEFKDSEGNDIEIYCEIMK